MKRIIQNRFVKNMSVYTSSDILNKMIPFILLPVLTRYLTPEDYGIIAMFFVFISILGIIMTLETNTAISVNYFKISRENLKIYIANILLVISVATCLTSVIILLFDSWFSKILAMPIEWLFLGVIVTLSQFITTINLVLWQSEQNPLPFGIYQILQTIVNLSLSLILIVGFSMGWEGRLIAVVVASVVFGMLSLVFLFKRDYVNFEYNKGNIKDALKFGIPLLPHSFSVWFRTGIDRVFLTSLVSASATGVYTVGFQIASVIIILTAAFNKAYSPYLFEKLKVVTEKDKTKIVKYAYMYFIILLVLAGSLSLLAPYLIDIFLGDAFIKSKEYVVWIAFGFAFYGMYSMVVNYVLYSKKTIYLSYVTFSISILHVGISYLLILNDGALGAAQATTITSFLTFVGVWWLSQRLYPMPWFGEIER